MGGVNSAFDEYAEESYKHKHLTKPVPHPRLNTSRILDVLSTTFEKWQEIVINMRDKTIPENDAQVYLYQEMLITRDALNSFLNDMSPSFVSYYQDSVPKMSTSKLHQSASNSDEYKEPNRVHRELIKKYVQMEEDLEKLNVEKKAILLRLSQVTGEKLKLNNPNITSLDDPYRPTNLVEMVSELYDNEWTDAFEGLQARGRTNSAAIRILLETFMDINIFCKGKRSEFLRLSGSTTNDLFGGIPTIFKKEGLKRSRSFSNMNKDIFQYADTIPDREFEPKNAFLFYEWLDKSVQEQDEKPIDRVICPEESNHIEEFYEKLKFQLKDSDEHMQGLLKEYGEYLSPLVEQEYLKARWTKDCIKILKPYIKKCLHVAWMMCIQTPPMAVITDARIRESFDFTRYKQYTSKGSYLEFVVWPAILLYENGPVVSKGVAQGMEK